MRVVFSRLSERHYGVTLLRDGARDTGTDIPLWPGPGDARVPHDLLHFVVEEQLGLRLGIYGQTAAGGGLRAFGVTATDRSGAARKRSERLRYAGRPDMRVSERVVSLIGPDGRLRDVVCAGDATLTPDVVRRLEERLRAVLADWSRVPVGGSLTLEWPAELTLKNARTGPHLGGSRRGHRSTRARGRVTRPA